MQDLKLVYDVSYIRELNFNQPFFMNFFKS